MKRKMWGAAIIITVVVLCQGVPSRATDAAAEVVTVDRLATVGESVVLSCNNAAVNASPGVTEWSKDGKLVLRHNSTSTEKFVADSRLAIVNNSALQISNVSGSDEGVYLCNVMPSDIQEQNQHPIKLVLVSGPDAVSINITPAVVLLNGTYYTIQGSEVTYTCSSQSYPAQELSWVFEGLASKPLNVTSGNGTSLSFKKINIIPIDQGNYSCSARNPVSGKTVTSSIAMLVYYRPSRAPRCSSQTGNNASDLLLLCSWTGGYPEPTLQWKHDDEETPGDWQPVLSASAANASLDVTMSRTQLHDGQVLKCVGEHPAVLSRMELPCSVKLKAPYPEGEPMITGISKQNVTLTCQDKDARPPPKITWLRGVRQEEIVPSSKYIISQGEAVSTLVITNCSKESDEGFYFCRSENPVGVRELEVHLSIKSSAYNVGGLIGVVLAIVIVGSGGIIGAVVYLNRERIFLGHRVWSEERNDVLMLVDSDDDAPFEDDVSGLTSLTNGNATPVVNDQHTTRDDHEEPQVHDEEPQEKDIADT
ncbi:V-set and immunoglobulin domain-containing protein 10-like [Acipenser ruthenus]|uniref:V-set and immunoglobulin domain-containing protein 10-like n=1 Tax=Acipenser ruthenus TaxID=7906 RepID=UPI002740E778|nr:V-set and immunoglobulin domain-containing protein 10-like [Acipenser ruthenus]